MKKTTFTDLPLEYKELWLKAVAAMDRSHSPYSGYDVGAAILCEGQMYAGCNISNASYPCGTCAEGTAIGNMFIYGKFKRDDGTYRVAEAIAVVARRHEGPVEGVCRPCGLCRQRLEEIACLSNKELLVISSNTDGSIIELDYIYPASQEDKLHEGLLPGAFGPSNLGK